MTEIEARIRCLELAAQLAARTDRCNGDGIKEIARQLFAFAGEKSEGEAPPPQAARRKKASRGGR